MRTIFVGEREYEVLYSGLRGAHCLGLQDENSDEDTLSVLKTLDRLGEQNVDAAVISLQDFTNKVLSCEVEALEALFLRTYITNEYAATYTLLRESVLDSYALSNAKLKFKLFRAVRNQYKLYLRFLREGEEAKAKKALAKTYLYLTLSRGEEDALGCYVKHSLKRAVVEEYRAIKYAASLEALAERAEEYRLLGTDKATRELEKARLLGVIDALKG